MKQVGIIPEDTPETSQPLLSVIVPCYNAEQYIDRCISSIVGQTYTNLEILLIDDGSVDTTGLLCDNRQKQDQRIRVIHKPNEGLAYARKTGVDNAEAEYIAFVDADDWIDKNMYTDMMSILLSTGSDIAQCGYCEVSEDGYIKHDVKKNENVPSKIVERKEGVLLILEDIKWRSYMWNKIFKKHLFDHVAVPKGRIYEDIAMTHLLFHNASQSVYLPHEYYFYYQSSDSLCRANNHALQMKNFYCDYTSGCFERYFFVMQHPEYHGIFLRMKHKLITLILEGLRRMVAYPNNFPAGCFEKYAQQLRSIPYTWKDFIFCLLHPVKTSEWLILTISAKMYTSIMSFFVKVKRRLRRYNIIDNVSS